MNVAAIIEALGGKSEVCRLTGAKPNAVVQWRWNGIPSRYWHTIVGDAVRRDVTGISFEVLQSSKPISSPTP